MDFLDVATHDEPKKFKEGMRMMRKITAKKTTEETKKMKQTTKMAMAMGLRMERKRKMAMLMTRRTTRTMQMISK